MNPLAAFQVLVLTMAGAMFVEAVKPQQKAKLAFWGIFLFLALLGVATNLIAGAWPAASSVMIWIGSSPITFLVVFLGWVAYLQKPWRRIKSPSGVVDFASLTSTEYNALTEDIRKQGLSIAGAVDLAESAKQTAVATNEFVVREADELKAALDALKREYTAHQSLNADALRAQFDNIYLALAAISHWERIIRLGDEIEKDAESLSAPTADTNFKLDEAGWSLWAEREEQWRSKLGRWLEIADYYKRGVSQAILSTPEGLYRSKDWTIMDGQFPNSNAVHAYKTFRLILSNWKNEWGNVNWRVAQAAFHGRAAAIIGGEE